MPLFDYTCGNCGQTTEALKSVLVNSIPCPACGHDAARVSFYRVNAKIYGEVRNWAVQDAKGRYRLTDFKEAEAEVADAKSRG